MNHRTARLLLAGLLAAGPGPTLAVASAGDAPSLLAQAQPDPRGDRPPGTGDGAWSDVRAFGAHGDGKSDDTKALRDAVAAVKSAGGGVVYLPAGQYRVNPTTAGVIGTAFNFSSQGGDWYAAILIDSDDVTIRCASQRTTFTIAASETGKRTNAVIALKGAAGRPVRRARVERCSFDLRNQAGAVALYAQHVQELGFVDNAVRNHASGVDAVTLDNTVGAIIARNQWRDGAIATGLYQSSSVTITANSFYNVAEALDADKPVTQGIGLAGHGITVTGNVYDRDAADTTGDAAWEINGFTDVVIADNTIRRSNNGIHLTAKIRNGKPYPAERITIKNNTIEGVNGIGIALADINENAFVNHRDIVIEGNVISGSGREGIRIRGTNVLVRGNIIRGSGGFGIEATQLLTGRAYNANRLTHFVIADNLISEGAKAGIHSDGAVQGTFSGNRAYRNGGGNPSIELIDNEHVIVVGNSTSDGAVGIRIISGAAWSGGKSVVIGNMATEPQGFRWDGTLIYTAVGNVGAYIPIHQQQ